MKDLHKHYVIILPGLGNETERIKQATSFWNKYDIAIIVYDFDWHSKSDNFSSLLMRLLDTIDNLNPKQNKISLIGCSAGGSLAINAFAQNRQIHKIINVCGRLRKGPEKGFRSFKNMTRSSQMFANSVEVSETNLKTLTNRDKKRIMSMKPLLGDELVPGDTVTVDGAKNITLPSIEHVLTIGAALTIFSKIIINFLKSDFC